MKRQPTEFQDIPSVPKKSEEIHTPSPRSFHPSKQNAANQRTHQTFHGNLRSVTCNFGAFAFPHANWTVFFSGLHLACNQFFLSDFHTAHSVHFRTVTCVNLFFSDVSMHLLDIFKSEESPFRFATIPLTLPQQSETKRAGRMIVICS